MAKKGIPPELHALVLKLAGEGRTGEEIAEIGAPAFVRSSTCTAECTQWDGHAAPCAANSVVFVYGLKPQPVSVFRSYRDLSAPPVSCPHCGGDLGTTSTT